MAVRFGPGNERAIPRHLVVLDGLAACQQAGVTNGSCLKGFDNFFAFFEQTFYSLARNCLSGFAEFLEDLFEAMYLLNRFFAMRGKNSLQVRVMRSFHHLRQCLQNLPFGIVDIPQKMREQLIQGRGHGSMFLGFEPGGMAWSIKRADRVAGRQGPPRRRQ